MKRIAALLSLLSFAPPAAAALSFAFPGPADQAAEKSQPLGSYAVPIGPWVNGAIKTVTAEGPVRQTAWRIEARDVTTLQILAPLREQLVNAGYTPLYECATAACGGFDFRYSTDILPEPEMHVDLGDFRFLSAKRQTDEGTEYISLMVSRSTDSGFVQVTRIGSDALEGRAFTASTKSPDVPDVLSETTSKKAEPAVVSVAGLGDRLETGGAIPLDDLSFDSGSSDLSAGEYPSLAELAAYLKAHPDRVVALVGHTDSAGGLDGNIALSRKRATSVMNRLIGEYGVNKAQVDAEGVGFLSPRASNLTEAGRTENRRVEVMLTSTQ